MPPDAPGDDATRGYTPAVPPLSNLGYPSSALAFSSDGSRIAASPDTIVDLRTGTMTTFAGQPAGPYAASINPADWYSVEGPLVARVGSGLRAPGAAVRQRRQEAQAGQEEQQPAAVRAGTEGTAELRVHCVEHSLRARLAASAGIKP